MNNKTLSFLIIFVCFICLSGCSTSTNTDGNNSGDDVVEDGSDGDADGDDVVEDGSDGDADADGESGENITSNDSTSAIIADHDAVTGFDSGFPSDYVTAVKNNLNIYYGHTSHGSQPITGLGMLGSPYNSGLDITEIDADLGHEDSTDWFYTTQDALAEDSSINVVIWAWCGGVSDNTSSGINTYLSHMNTLEQNYPNVTFVYMTGRHWNQDGSASEGETVGTNTHIEEMNSLIRSYVRSNHKILYDFADIEEYDPDERQYTNTSDYCSWCSAWCSSHSCPSCGYEDCCEHAHSYNCYIKGKAFWWLLARIAGWDGN